jgi:hypothetical protein
MSVLLRSRVCLFVCLFVCMLLSYSALYNRRKKRERHKERETRWRKATHKHNRNDRKVSENDNEGANDVTII